MPKIKLLKTFIYFIKSNVKNIFAELEDGKLAEKLLRQEIINKNN